MKVIILAGGSGTRLWPLSRNCFPKQFLMLKNMDKSIFQMSFLRCLRLVSPEEIYIVTNSNYKFLVLGQIEELGYKFNENNILVEPGEKNTLPAICYGVKEIQKSGDDVAVVIPSDHIIEDEEKFAQTIKAGQQLAPEYIVTYGIRPSKPHTGYGYIKPKTPLAVGYLINKFNEKPDYQKAIEYLEKGYLWNSGIFMFRTDVLTEEVRQYCQEVHELFKLNNIDRIYEQIPNMSIDYGIMEKSKRVAVIPLDVKWSDLGSFDAFYDEFNSDENGNIVFGDNILIDSCNNLLYTDKDKAVALIGVRDLIVIDEKDGLLICKKDQSQKVKDAVDIMKENHDPRVYCHLTTYRTWGFYTILEEDIFYKIKHITVLPGKKLNYQLHLHRSEHWIVVKGTARVTVEDNEVYVSSGESTFVQSGLKHRLENPGKALLEVIEVQFGECLEDDDILRHDDDFGRCTISYGEEELVTSNSENCSEKGKNS